MPLIELDLDYDDRSPLPEEIVRWLSAAQDRVQVFWDQFPQRPLAQYVECDFELVARALQHCLKNDLIDGRMFVEWGCGFGVVTGIASLLGLDAIGVEAEQFLASEAQQLLDTNQIKAEVWQGNFLPQGADRLAEEDDPVVSLSHTCEPAYESRGISLNDFAMVFVYPWPGEEHFLKAVFQRFARSAALLLLYRGPYHLELYAKQ